MDSRRVCQIALTIGLLVLSPMPVGAAPKESPAVNVMAAADAGIAGWHYVALLNRNEARRQFVAWIAAVAPESAPRPPESHRTAVAVTQWPASYQPCDGDYPPCWRVETESRGDYNAYNPTGCYYKGRSGCYGKWQFGWFWGGKLGLPVDLATATPAQQDEAARLLWNHGAGCSNWSAC